MEISICIGFFLLGTIFGSFYNVVGSRLPKGESIIRPASHCTICNHKLGPLELIPILSYLIQGGRCRHCKNKISPSYLGFELFCGALFLISYLVFGFSYELILSLTFVSMLDIIIVSDLEQMIIPDSVLIIFGLLIVIEKCYINGVDSILPTLGSGLIAFAVMFGLKIFGDIIFKQESMGGGDIKLLGIFGLMLGWSNALITIIVAAFIGLPISLIAINFKKTHIVPFGPFLSLGALVVLFTKIDINYLLEFFKW